ncbi:CMRF35-like molecule 5 isoform X4 [Saccopteryx leptura]|uniref:CMRF35-like molecule 5 isoform X4 n=1 Tax=Saccopteryx leptura TaxID=249018 RepID=UPI00339D2582
MLAFNGHQGETWAGWTMWLLLPLLLLITPGSSYVITGPEEVSDLEQGSLTVQCHYDPGWETYRKWWCRGAEWKYCEILVTTTETEWEVKKDRVSIKDDQRSCVFTVTMEKLRQEDTDVYWCGIERNGAADLGIQVKVTIGPVAARCHYGPRWEAYMKQWCGEADESSCTILVQTTGSKQAKKNRAYIDQEKRTFTVTLQN